MKANQARTMQNQPGGADEWPKKVECPGGVVVTIYKRRVHDGWGYLVANRTGGGRRLDSYATEELAVAAAKKIGKALARGDVASALMKSADVASYGRAAELLRPTGLSLEVAAATLAEVWKHTPDPSTIIEACRDFALRARTVTPKQVQAVVDELVALKQARGASPRHVGDLRSRLNKFGAAFKVDICTVLTADVQRWIDGLKLGAQSSVNYRRVLHQLWSFAVARGYASKNVVAGAERVKVRSGEIEVYSPKQYAAFLAQADESTIPFLVIAGFAGLRTQEVLRLEWRDVDFAAGHIIVGTSKSKTASRRIVEMSANLREWLAPYAKRTGRIWERSGGNLHKQLRAVAERAGGEWLANAARHSFASYRFAQLGDAGRVAGEMGNSAQVVHRHYRQLATREDAEAWFGIRPPSTPANVIQISAAGGVQ